MADAAPEELGLEVASELGVSAFATWQAAPCGLVPSVSFGGMVTATRATTPSSLDEQPDNVIVFIRFASEWVRLGNSTTWIAITKIAHDPSSGRIVDADTEVNDGGYKFSADGTPEVDEVDLLSTLTHEAGHFFGMDHSPVTDATMYATYAQSAAGPLSARDLAQDDIDGICALYTDLPACDGCGAHTCGIDNCGLPCGDCANGEACEEGLCTPLCPTACEGSACSLGGCEACPCVDGRVCTGELCEAPPSPFRLSSVTPEIVANDRATSIAVGGEGFALGMVVSLGDRDLDNIRVESSALLTAWVPAGFPPGTYELNVTSPTGETRAWDRSVVVAAPGSKGEGGGCSTGSSWSGNGALLAWLLVRACGLRRRAGW